MNDSEEAAEWREKAFRQYERNPATKYLLNHVPDAGALQTLLRQAFEEGCKTGEGMAISSVLREMLKTREEEQKKNKAERM